MMRWIVGWSMQPCPLPLALAGQIPGNEIEHPMAVVILGGLVTSTLLNLFVVPPLCLRFGGLRDVEIGRRQHD